MIMVSASGSRPRLGSDRDSESGTMAALNLKLEPSTLTNSETTALTNSETTRQSQARPLPRCFRSLTGPDLARASDGYRSSQRSIRTGTGNTVRGAPGTARRPEIQKATECHHKLHCCYVCRILVSSAERIILWGVVIQYYITSKQEKDWAHFSQRCLKR